MMDEPFRPRRPVVGTLAGVSLLTIASVVWLFVVSFELFAVCMGWQAVRSWVQPEDLVAAWLIGEGGIAFVSSLVAFRVSGRSPIPALLNGCLALLFILYWLAFVGLRGGWSCP